MKYLVILSILIINYHREQFAPKVQTIHQNRVDTSNYAVIKFDSAKHKMYFDGQVQPAMLSSAELTKIDKIVTERILLYNKEGEQIAKDHGKQYLSWINPTFKRYKQVIPVMNGNDQKEVWVNCFCHKPWNNYDWKTDIVMVLDGGNCYFQLKINLTTSTVVSFSVNGSS